MRAAITLVPFALTFACAAPERASQPVTVNDDAAVVLIGGFEPISHEVSGAVRIEVDAETRVLFSDDFSILNGPALIVGLSHQPVETMTNANAWPDDTVDLGPLVGAAGAQEYVVSSDVDVGEFSSVVVWCEAFSVAFGAASFGVE